jgi:hypothetical protein
LFVKHFIKRTRRIPINTGVCGGYDIKTLYINAFQFHAPARELRAMLAWLTKQAGFLSYHKKTDMQDIFLEMAE